MPKIIKFRAGIQTHSPLFPEIVSYVFLPNFSGRGGGYLMLLVDSSEYQLFAGLLDVEGHSLIASMDNDGVTVLTSDKSNGSLCKDWLI